jgi:hypothetical protein
MCKSPQGFDFLSILENWTGGWCFPGLGCERNSDCAIGIASTPAAKTIAYDSIWVLLGLSAAWGVGFAMAEQSNGRSADDK